MSEVDRSEAKARLDSLFDESKQNNEGAGIPEIVEAVLGDDADEEIAELVLMAMGDSGTISRWPLYTSDAADEGLGVR